LAQQLREHPSRRLALAFLKEQLESRSPVGSGSSGGT
jgi:hypothetical protein